MYAIYEITPDPEKKDDYRYIQGFDKRKDAEYVLKALEKVNIDFNLYKIIHHTEICSTIKK